jgi:hypothetical protein
LEAEVEAGIMTRVVDLMEIVDLYGDTNFVEG